MNKLNYLNPRCVYHGKRIDLLEVNLEIKGKIYSRELVDHPGAVVILPILENKEVILIKNYRFAIGEVLIELPAGTLEGGEDPLECGKRELEEETGYRSNSMHFLFSIYPTPGFCNEILHIYEARDLHYVGQKLDATEQIETQALSISQALLWIKEGKIKDAKTIATLLYMNTFSSDFFEKNV